MASRHEVTVSQPGRVRLHAAGWRAVVLTLLFVPEAFCLLPDTTLSAHGLPAYLIGGPMMLLMAPLALVVLLLGGVAALIERTVGRLR